jgi:hypothetical protein
MKLTVFFASSILLTQAFADGGVRLNNRTPTSRSGTTGGISAPVNRAPTAPRPQLGAPAAPKAAVPLKSGEAPANFNGAPTMPTVGSPTVTGTRNARPYKIENSLTDVHVAAARELANTNSHYASVWDAYGELEIAAKAENELDENALKGFVVGTVVSWVNDGTPTEVVDAMGNVADRLTHAAEIAAENASHTVMTSFSDSLKIGGYSLDEIRRSCPSLATAL